MALKSLSTSALRAELARREKGAGKLAAQHGKLAARLAEIDAELAGLGVNGVARRGRRPGRPAGRRGPGRPPGRRGPGRPPKAGRRGRAKNALSLHEALAKVVRVGSTVSPAAAAAAVKRIYKTASKTFGIQVATTLAKSPLFKKTGRGAYQRKGGSAPAPARRGPKPKLGRRGRRVAKRGRKPGRPKGSKNKQAAQAAAATSAS
ncbi:MAG TPA: hypothetical protein VFD43_00435 [Planctomycetota bacterium]|nr:hypothetical protein [Planctomycetota bacterium]